MGRIQSNIGLITGLPIQDTVDQLMAVQARSRDLVVARGKELLREREAIATLTAKALAVQFAAARLGRDSVFDAKSASSSRPELIQVTTTGNPADGSYQLTPVRQAQAQQLLSTGFASRDNPIGAGSFSLRFGGFVDQPVELETLNAGRGVRRGQIRLTDRSGATATVDLRFARTIDDVLAAINANPDVAVTAVARGDALQLIDDTGQTAAHLKVEEVGAGSTAADLGLSGIDADAGQATGRDVLRLFDDLPLAGLNDGNGLSIRSALPDLTVSFRDGSSPLSIDFHRAEKPAEAASATLLSANGVNASLTIEAVQTGGTYDGVTVRFIDDGSAIQGAETVVYDDSDPLHKTLTFNIDAGATTANDVISALTGDPAANQLFTARTAAGGNGSGRIDLSDTAVTAGGAAVESRRETTLGDLLATINEADPARLRAELSPDGDRLLLHDLTGDLGGTFAVTSPLGGSLAEDLGLTGTAVDGALAGRRLLSGLRTTLLSSLNGGRGLGNLGQLQLTDRAGTVDTVDLASAETLDDVLAAINGAAVGISATVNAARSGILLTDTTGQVTGNLIVASIDGSGTADKLGIALNAAENQVESGSLHRQVVHEQTRLDAYNGGRGAAAGSIVITNSTGVAMSFRVRPDTVTTVGDLLEMINAETFGVTARINDAGDGIALLDTAGGGGELTVTEIGGGTTARDLRLTGPAVPVGGGEPGQQIDGSTTFTVEIGPTDSLTDIVQQINQWNAGIAAGIISDGSGTAPHRLILRSETSGMAGQLMFHAEDAGFSLHEIVAAQDALLLYGSADSSGAGILVASSDNQFDNVLDGLTLTLAGESTAAVGVTVRATNEKLVSEVKLFAEQYNALRDTLDQLTFFNEEENKVGVLFGSAEALRIDNDLARVLTGSFSAVKTLRSLAELGIGVGDDGKIQLDEARLKAGFAADPAAVKQFFTAADTGVVARFDAALETLVGADRSVLVNRSVTLQRKVDVLTQRTELLNTRLASQRQRMLLDFYRMELAVSKVQNNLSALSAINVGGSTLFGGNSQT